MADYQRKPSGVKDQSAVAANLVLLAALVWVSEQIYDQHLVVPSGIVYSILSDFVNS